MKKAALAAAFLAVFGCTYNGLLDMDEQGYNYYSDVMAFSERCFQLGQVSPELMASTAHNLGVVVSLLNHDPNQLKQRYSEKLNGLSSTFNVGCRATEVEMRKVIAHGERIQRNQAAQAGRSVVPTTVPFNKPVWCNTVGTTTMCN